MKFILTFKDPDYNISPLPSIDEAKKLQSILSKFVDCDEYVTIEINTETQTAKVLEN